MTSDDHGPLYGSSSETFVFVAKPIKLLYSSNAIRCYHWQVDANLTTVRIFPVLVFTSRSGSLVITYAPSTLN